MKTLPHMLLGVLGGATREITSEVVVDKENSVRGHDGLAQLDDGWKLVVHMAESDLNEDNRVLPVGGLLWDVGEGAFVELHAELWHGCGHLVGAHDVDVANVDSNALGAGLLSDELACLALAATKVEQSGLVVDAANINHALGETVRGLLVVKNREVVTSHWSDQVRVVAKVDVVLAPYGVVVAGLIVVVLLVLLDTIAVADHVLVDSSVVLGHVTLLHNARW